MAATAPLTLNSPETSGWQARLELGLRRGPDRTQLHHRRRYGPLAVQRPFYPEGETCHIYPLHPPGGVVGGDQLSIDVESGDGARSLLTTPGAAKFYRSVGPRALATQKIRLHSGSCLEWLPQESILFPGAHVRSRLDIDLAVDARLIAWEIWCLGRPLNDEPFDQGALDAATVLVRDGHTCLHDRLRVTPDNRQNIALTAARPVLGQMLLTPADTDLAARLKEHEQRGPDDLLALTLLEDLLVVRYAGHSVAMARRMFARIWADARPSVIGLEPVPPRIWST